MSHSSRKLVTGLFMFLTTLPLCGQEFSIESDNAAPGKAKTQAEVVVKVIQIENADASDMKGIIDELFPTTPDEHKHGLPQMRIGIDARTNSIVASGTVDDLQVVEDLLARLDTKTSAEGTSPQKTTVYRLQNAAVSDVADAINQWLTERARLQGRGDPGKDSGKNKVPKNLQCVLVPEVVSNSLIVSTSLSEERAAELDKIIRALDTRPDMVKIKVVLKKTVGGIETVLSRPHLMTLDQRSGSLTIGSELESYTIELTPHIIRGDKPIEVSNIPAKSEKR